MKSILLWAGASVILIGLAMITGKPWPFVGAVFLVNVGLLFRMFR